MSGTYTIVHGTRSGRGRGAQRGAAVAAAVRATGREVHEVEAQSIEQARDAFAAAVAQGAEVLAVAGGDGVVGLAAAACAGSQTALALIPAGTGNDNARSLEIPLDLAGATAVVLEGTVAQIDLIRVDPSGRVVLGSVPAGVDARIAERSNSLPKWLGPAVYAAATLPEIPRLRPVPYCLRLDGVAEEVDALVVATCNMPIYGGGMRIAPQADPTDGLLDVVIIGPVRASAALSLLRGVFSGRHAGHPSVRIERASRVEISGPDLQVHGDGEPIEPLPVTCSVLPGALRVLVPAQASAAQP